MARLRLHETGHGGSTHLIYGANIRAAPPAFVTIHHVLARQMEGGGYVYGRNEGADGAIVKHDGARESANAARC
jgi:hypothetical protein